ncbi:MAG: sigma 54-interacting transcriptional regulator [Myxococcales bacterium]|nr:sigma 54-interacting transcriptional regulator [Myxococcales bacterium]
MPATFPLPDSGKITLGRGETCEVRVDDASVSREHARLSVDGRRLTLEDLGSSNGTRVAGRRLGQGERASVDVDVVFELGAVAVVVRGAAPAAPAHVVSSLDAPAPGGKMAQAAALADLVARAPVGVLVLGETGVGKTVIAERIHRASGRTGDLVKLNCAAVPETLLEGELFGYERGAFTGAQAAKPGLVEAADHGTLLLDEIGDMPLATQAKLLHAVESGEVTRLGALKPRSVDVRFIAATHRDLPAMVAAGAFRADLYYRINGITISIPPLRERRDELLTLAVHFLSSTCARMGRETPRLLDGAKNALLGHAWPGNLRELRNVMDRAALLSLGAEIDADAIHIEGTPRAGLGDVARPAGAVATPSAHEPAPGDLRKDLSDFERDRIVAALEEAGGNQARAAELLGLPLRTLVKRLTRHGLTRARRRESD